ncbi:hypothetical protein [Staphylococcus felis]|uniref:hypothetical protein n=1 Tax=Staphylococcus felis TaxID=46127 RepID=UPI0015F26BD6|nr:hypothetical protein [Staphylococcus felis]
MAEIRMLRKERRNVMENTRRFYLQRITLDKIYLENNVKRFNTSINQLANSEEEKVKYFRNIYCLPYYISSINNRELEATLKKMKGYTEDYLKTVNIYGNDKLLSYFNLHNRLEKVLNMIVNNNYIISMMFKDYDDSLSEDYMLIQKILKDETYWLGNLNYKDILQANQFEVLYSSYGNPDTLVHATPIMYYNKKISDLRVFLDSDDCFDIGYIAINENKEKGDIKSLMKSLDVGLVIKYLEDIIQNINEINRLSE